MVRTPVFASLSTSSIFVANEIDAFSFWRPSLGPTSTIRTKSELLPAGVLYARRRADAVADKVRSLEGIVEVM